MRLLQPLRDDAIEAEQTIRTRLARPQPQADRGAAVGGNRAHIEPACLGAFARGIYRLAATVDNVFVKGILAVILGAAHPE